MNVNATVPRFDGPGHHTIQQLHKQHKPTDATWPETTVAETATEPKQPGVIWNLLEGHYRGVADVRLRLNFQTELQAIHQQNTTAILDAGANSLISELASEIQNLAGVEPLAANIESSLELVDQLDSDLRRALADGADSQTSIEALRIASDDFLAAIGTLLAGEQEAPAPGEQTDSPDDVAYVDALRQRLDDIVDTHLNALQSSLAESGLPDPTPPHGNGVAFEKFMAIYRANQPSA